MAFRIFWERLGEEQSHKAKAYLNAFFKNTTRPDYLGDIKVTYLNLGDRPPIVRLVDISNTKKDEIIPETNGNGNGKYTNSDLDLEIKLQVEYSGNAKISIETELLINFPKPRFATLPVSLSLSEFIFEGTVHISHHNGKIFVSFEESENGPMKSVKVDSHLGDRAKEVRSNLGRVESFIVEQLKAKLKKALVHPNGLTLPSDNAKIT